MSLLFVNEWSYRNTIQQLLSSMLSKDKSAGIDQLLQKNHLLPVPVLSDCTVQLQPVDLSVNKAIKDQLWQSFTGIISSVGKWKKESCKATNTTAWMAYMHKFS